MLIPIARFWCLKNCPRQNEKYHCPKDCESRRTGDNTIRGLGKIGLTAERITNMLFTHQHVDHNGGFWDFFIGGWQGPTGSRSLNLIGPQFQELYDNSVKSIMPVWAGQKMEC
ncbi:hypothetical protein [Bacillus sp. B4EP4a]|uniref:hypothetical protein n=1 Tax=Bacillus sp. B4EP4a TaxID=2590665 RepID=UPI0011530495|nr:hypothetical protein [Bacillus sp. B4EP4a]